MVINEFQTLKAAETLSMLDAFKTTAIGLIVVFAILFLLIVCIELLHLLLKDKLKPQENVQLKKEERISAGVMAEIPEDVTKDGEFIAAVSAAISAYTGKSNGSFVIKSIKKG